VRFSNEEVSEMLLEKLRMDTTAVGIIRTANAHALAELRRIFFELVSKGIVIPVVIQRTYPHLEADSIRIYSATDAGGLFIDGFGDGIMLASPGSATKESALQQADLCNKTAFGILQAARTRMSKTEYISCPSCGRTLFDLQSTTAMIRKRTDHLKGVKIGIMGCIVNGPGEMADADYGYVGSGPSRITLYRGKEVVKRSVPSAQAVDELINLIKEDGNWIDLEAPDQI
jgi:(E)-4-hydroxy-3-methylbut-2-enyl-diphosphate synthase